jgi:hypothetical protein
VEPPIQPDLRVKVKAKPEADAIKTHLLYIYKNKKK